MPKIELINVDYQHDWQCNTYINRNSISSRFDPQRALFVALSSVLSHRIVAGTNVRPVQKEKSAAVAPARSGRMDEGEDEGDGLDTLP